MSRTSRLEVSLVQMLNACGSYNSFPQDNVQGKLLASCLNTTQSLFPLVHNAVPTSTNVKSCVYVCTCMYNKHCCSFI